MFRWVYDLTNNSQLSWLKVQNNRKSVPYRNTRAGAFFSNQHTRYGGHPVTPQLTDLARQGDRSERRENLLTFGRQGWKTWVTEFITKDIAALGTEPHAAGALTWKHVPGP